MSFSYPAIQAGLTNQKIALIGLIHKALRDNTALVLPQLMSYHPHSGQHVACDMAQVYQTDTLESVFDAFSVPYTNTPSDAETIDGWQCFWEGADRWGEVGRAGTAAWPNLTAQSIRFLRPTPLLNDLAEFLHQKLSQAGIQHALQLRIERDWQGYAADVLPSFAGKDEDYALPFSEIIEKAKNTWGPDFKKAYILCDEECLPASKETIRNHASAALGVELFWKSDFLPAQSLHSNLISSIIDFEIALKTPFFAGNSRSTFACFVAFEKFCRTGTAPQNHFLYNLHAQHLGLRQDIGPMMTPEEATDSLCAHRPLLSPEAGDVLWPLSLTAHIATVGDRTIAVNHQPDFPYGTLCLDASARPERALEGLQFDSNGTAPPLEYRTRDQNGQETPWAPLGTFCGSRGQNCALTAFGVRVAGPTSLMVDCLYAGCFEGAPEALPAQNGAWCHTPENGKLLGVHVVFRAKRLV